MRESFWNARRDRLATCAYMGMTKAEAAADTGLTVTTVRTYAMRYGLKFAKSQRGPKPIDPADVRAKLQPLADSGLTLSQAAGKLGMAYPTLVSHANKSGVRFTTEWDKQGDPNRSDAMASMYRAGKTLEEIGQLYGITRERVRQILSRDFGIDGSDGGQAVLARVRKVRKASEREADCFAKNGCSTAQLKELRRIGRRMASEGACRERTPTGAFSTQRSNARNRGIEWSLTLWDWWTIWQESGKWDERGRTGDAYVMCRFRDDGPYSVGNVYIATQRHNLTVQPNNPYRKSHPDFEKTMAARNVRTFSRPGISRHTVHVGLPVGVTLHKQSGRLACQSA